MRVSVSNWQTSDGDVARTIKAGRAFSMGLTTEAQRHGERITNRHRKRCGRRR